MKNILPNEKNYLMKHNVLNRMEMFENSRKINKVQMIISYLEHWKQIKHIQKWEVNDNEIFIKIIF